MSTSEHRSIETVWRIESAVILAAVARIVRDVGTAEEIAQDVFLAALERWPRDGMPEKPGAWLMATARRRAIDHVRRLRTFERKEAAIGHELEALHARSAPDPDAALDDDLGDELLGLIFATCHPSLPTEGRVALTLRLLGGLTTDEIARAFLVSESTVAQRIVRAKRTLADAAAAFEVPRGESLAERLSSVLDVISLVFNEGYAASAGEDWIRPSLCEEALRLGRVVAQRMPGEPEAHGLVALMELQASRFGARTAPDGAPILLLDQDRARWDWMLIGRGLAALARAEALDAAPGPWALQAAIAACHARARRASDTDWARIASLYERLARVWPSPVVELNRAVAVGMAQGPAAGLALADTLREAPALKSYHLLPSVRADLLSKLGRHEEAKAEFERAASLTSNARSRALLLARAAQSADAAAAAKG